MTNFIRAHTQKLDNKLVDTQLVMFIYIVMPEQWVGGTFYQFIHVFIIIKLVLTKLSDPAACTMKFYENLFFCKNFLRVWIGGSEN